VNDDAKLIVASIMSDDVHTVTAERTLGELKTIFEKVSYHHLLVENEGKLVGVISDRDVARNLSPFLETSSERRSDRSLLDMSAAELMATQLITVGRESSIDFASILLLENNISCLPVVRENGQIDGIVSWKDILKCHVYGVEP